MAKKTAGSETTAWNRFSQHTRVKRCLETTGFPFVGICVTCGKKFHISYLDCGHCIAGRSNSLLFNERRVDIQCRHCNRVRNGRLKKFQRILAQRYYPEANDSEIQDIIDRWKAESKKPVKNKDMDYPAIAKKYQELTNDLLGESYEDMLAGHSW